MQRGKPAPYVDRLASGLEQFLAQLAGGLPVPTEPVSDSLLSGSLHQQTLGGQAGVLRSGRIQYALPQLNWYRVALDEGGAVVAAASCHNFNPGLVGPKLHTLLAPDTAVWLVLHPGGHWGYILGAIPRLATDGNVAFGDWIQQGSAVGLRRLAYYREWVNSLAQQGGAKDFSAHGPQDQLITDYSLLTELGGGLHLDPCQSFLRLDEFSGLFLYYFDRLARLAGQNLDILSMVHQEQYRHDEGELSYYRGECLYPWEFLGVFLAADQARSYQEHSDRDVHFDAPYGKLEPAASDQQSFCRYEEYGGYLGQGRLRQIVLPPAEVWEDSSYLYRYGGSGSPLTVLRESLLPDGSYLLSSAKRICLIRRPPLPTPRRRQPAESYRDDADRAAQENYAFSGQLAGDTAHQVGEPARPAEYPQLAAAANLLDLHTYLLNWAAVHPFHYHEGDFTLPEDQQPLAPFPLADQAEAFWMEPPAPTPQRVDERYGEVAYYPLYSHLSLNDDGSVVLLGGLGEEIRLAGGNITLACPGHILLQSGKSTVVLAGDDAIVRARHSLDLTVSERDIRLKAQRNMLMVSGNGGEGGTLLENRAQGTAQQYPVEGGEQIVGSGIVLKAATSLTSLISSSIYLRTGNEDGGVGSGEIVLDAARGNANIRLVCFDCTRHIRNRAEDAFGLPEVQSVNVASATQTLLGGRLDVVDSIRSNSFLVCRDSIQTTDGHFGSRTGGSVGVLRNPGQQRAQLVRQIVNAADENATTLATEYRTQVQTALYGSGRPGNAAVQQQLSFGCRTPEEYGTTAFVLPQATWQVLAQTAGGVVPWSEALVPYQGGSQTTLPWPGRSKWQEEETLLTLRPTDLAFFDAAAGIPYPRGERYENGELGAFHPAIPAAAYTVIDTP